MADHKEYLTRLEIVAGHRRFGLVAHPKEVKEDDEGGTGAAGFLPSHPLLGDAAQFQGDHKFENHNHPDNPDAQKAAQLEFQPKLDHKHEQKLGKSTAPTLGR